MDRVTVFSRKIERWQLRPGDHIYAWFFIGIPYSHHGIYQSDDKVIQFTSSSSFSSSSSSSSSFIFCSKCRDSMCGGRVVTTCLRCFLEGHELRLFVYSVPWWFYNASIGNGFQDSCSMEDEDPPEMVLGHANYLHDHRGFGDYSLFFRNCFDFAFHCKTGRRYYSLLDIIAKPFVADEPSFSARDLRSVIRRWLF